jgi:hypothetical protein
MVNNMALTVGNLYGFGYRVAEPIKVRFESVPELLAVINAPPTHYDVIDGEEISVNPRTFRGYGSFTKLAEVEGVTSSFSLKRETVSIDSSANGVRFRKLAPILMFVVVVVHASPAAHFSYCG